MTMAPDSLQDADMTARFRRFLTDLAWPSCSSVLCDLTDLPAASAEVSDAESAESRQRMARLAQRADVTGQVMSAAFTLTSILDSLEDVEEQAIWLTTYAFAVVNMLEEMGVVEVAA
jgi:hypothetical protein